FKRGVALQLNTALEDICVEDGRVVGVSVRHLGHKKRLRARLGVVICAGGFEWNQELRNQYFAVPGLTRHSSTPEGANRGEALVAALSVDAATEHMETGWWIPTMSIPMP